MKCTDFYEKEKELKRHAIDELAMAIKSHGGKYEWCDEDGEFIEGVEAPIICALLDQGPTDVKIKAIYYDEKGWYITGEDCAEFGGDVDFDPDDFANAVQIQNVIEAISTTNEVKDVTGLYPAVVSYLCLDDLEYKGYDTTNLTQQDLESVASKMGNYHLDYGYWDDLENACDFLKIPRKEGENDEEGL